MTKILLLNSPDISFQPISICEIVDQADPNNNLYIPCCTAQYYDLSMLFFESSALRVSRRR